MADFEALGFHSVTQEFISLCRSRLRTLERIAESLEELSQHKRRRLEAAALSEGLE